MKLEGMRINFLGDSITEGSGTTAPEKTFHQRMKEKYNLKAAYNYGVGGTRIARQSVASKEFTLWDYTFEMRSEIMERDVDAVVVFGGTNDFGHGDAKFGTIDSNDVYTYCGAVNSLITKLEKNFPDAEIVFMTPISRVTENEPSLPDGKILSDYVQAMRDICKMRNVKLIDLYAIKPLNPFDEALVPDGLHPNDSGHEIMSDVIAKELMKL